MKRLTKIGLMLLAVLAMIIGTATPVSAAGYDNYVYASSGSTVRVSITSEYRPYVKFTLTKACDVRVRSRAELNDGWNQFLNLYIYNSSGIRQAHWEQAFSSSTDMAAIDRTISLSAGTYYIWQSTRWSATGGVVAQGTAAVTLNYPLVPQPTVTVKSVFGGKAVTFNCSNKNAYIYYELGTSSIGTASKHVKAGETVFFGKTVSTAIFYKSYLNGAWSPVCKLGLNNVKISAPLIARSGARNSNNFRVYTQTRDSYIVYTLDGSMPRINDGAQKLTVTNGRIVWGTSKVINVPRGRTLRAIAIRSGLVTSDVLTFINR